VTVVATSGPSHGSATVEADRTITYAPTLNYFGPDSFDYQVCDSDGACDTATVSITVTSVNDAPVAADDTATTDEDTAVTIDVLTNDTDVEDGKPGGAVTVTSGPSHGSATVKADRTITYAPTLNYFGPDSFDYQVCDSDGACDTATVSITVDPVTDATLHWVGVTLTQSGGYVPLRVTVTSDDGGSVIGSEVTFSYGSTTCTDTVVALYPGSDVGTAYCMGTLSVSSTSTVTVTAGLAGDASAPSLTQPITVFKGVQHTITGGGNLVLANSVGEHPANVGSKKNFGFNADSGKRGTRLKGDINIVYERTLGVDYQLKAPTIASVAVNHSTAYGEITGVADLTDLSTSTTIAQGLVLQVRLVDGDDRSPAGLDTVSYTAWAPDGHLVFATNWNVSGATWMLQGLDGGNIDIK
jgi:hypothetical protein